MLYNGTFQAELPKVSVREIQVKQVDRNIAHLRANQEIVSVGGSGGTQVPLPQTAPADTKRYLFGG